MASKVKDGKIITKKDKLKEALAKVNDPKYNVTSGRIEKTNKNDQTNIKKNIKEAKARKDSAFTINKDGKKVLKPRSFTEDVGTALSFLPAGMIRKQVGKKLVDKGGNFLSKIAKRFQGSSSSASSNKLGQGGGKFNPPTVRPNKNTTQIVKKPNTGIKKPTTTVAKRNTDTKVNKPLGPIKTIKGGNTRLAAPLLSSIISKQALASGNNVEKKEKKPIEKKPIEKIKKSTTSKVKKETLKKLEPVKNYTGKFVNKKGEVAYDSIGDFFKNMTGTAKKRVAPENRKRISAETKGATKGVGFSGDSVAKFKNPLKKNVGGSLKSVPKNNTGLGKLPTPVRNKMGFMKKGGIVKMKGGGAATKGMNFNRGY